MLAGDEKQAYENYMKADITKLDRGQLNEFARCSYFTGHFADALKASEAGMKLFPRNPTFVRLAMFSNYELKNLDAAKGYINRYFNETDSAKFSEYDHYYAALIYQDLEDKANAYAQYEKALELVNDSSMIKRWAILKSLSDSYAKDKNFDKAISCYQDYLACKPDLNSDDTEGLAKIYSKYAEADESKKSEMIGKAIGVYREMAEKFPIQNIYSAYQCATLNNKLDKNAEKGLAKGDFQKVVDLLEGKTDRDKSEDTMLKYSYHYLMTYAFLYGKNKPLAKEYAAKILAIDPDYAPAVQIRDLK
jgi:tetratricopeptide (TPR) repeat protein